MALLYKQVRNSELEHTSIFHHVIHIADNAFSKQTLNLTARRVINPSSFYFCCKSKLFNGNFECQISCSNAVYRF